MQQQQLTEHVEIKIYCNHPEHNLYPLEIIRIRNNNEYFVECPQCQVDQDKISELEDEVDSLQDHLDDQDDLEYALEEMDDNFEFFKKRLIPKLRDVLEIAMDENPKINQKNMILKLNDILDKGMEEIEDIIEYIKDYDLR